MTSATTVEAMDMAASKPIACPSNRPSMAALHASIAHAGNSHPPTEAIDVGSNMRGIMLPDSALSTKVITGAMATNRARDPHSAARATKNAALVTDATKLANSKANTDPGTN